MVRFQRQRLSEKLTSPGASPLVQRQKGAALPPRGPDLLQPHEKLPSVSSWPTSQASSPPALGSSVAVCRDFASDGACQTPLLLEDTVHDLAQRRRNDTASLGESSAIAQPGQDGHHPDRAAPRSASDPESELRPLRRPPPRRTWCIRNRTCEGCLPSGKFGSKRWLSHDDKHCPCSYLNQKQCRTSYCRRNTSTRCSTTTLQSESPTRYRPRNS